MERRRMASYLNAPVETPSTPPPDALLDPHEITQHENDPDHIDLRNDLHATLNQTFRHSFWRTRRNAIHRTLRQTHPNTTRLTRFETCGINAWICQSTTTPPKYRVRTNRCRDRFCEACARERRNLVAMNLARQLPKAPLRLLTLTLKSSSQPLAKQIKRLRESFRKLRNHRSLKNRISGGIYFLEITINPKTNLFHPHLHVIYSGDYLPVDLVRATWYYITGDSYICDVRYIKSPGIAAGYVTKYAAKSISADIWTNHNALLETIKALEGTRTFQTFGTWKTLDLSKVPEDGLTWIQIAPLAETILAAKSGDTIARDILNGLKREDLHPIEEIPTHPPPNG